MANCYNSFKIKGLRDYTSIASMYEQVFKLDWLLMSICILCVIAMLLYALIGLVEKWYLGRCKISG